MSGARKRTVSMECSTLNKPILRTVELPNLPAPSELAEPEGEIADLHITCAPALYADTCALSMFGYAIKPEHGLASNVIKIVLVPCRRPLLKCNQFAPTSAHPHQCAKVESGFDNAVCGRLSAQKGRDNFVCHRH